MKFDKEEVYCYQLQLNIKKKKDSRSFLFLCRKHIYNVQDCIFY